MPSNTQKTRNRRRNRKRNLGRDQKRERTQAGTPKFPIIPPEEGSEKQAS